MRSTRKHHWAAGVVAWIGLCMLAACGGGGSGGSNPSSSSSSNSSSSSSAAPTYTIGGTVSGLVGSGLVLSNNGGNNLSITANGAFTFSTALAAGAAYAITIATHPGAQNCTVTNASGTVGSANISNVFVTCNDRMFMPATTTLNTPRALHAATLLPNGLILITGGIINSALTATNTAELYDPVANTFTNLTAQMTSLRNQHTATLLPNGKVLIAGGSNHGDGDGMDTAELYDPLTQTFTALAPRMKSPRGGHTATLLSSGKVLLASGFYNGPEINSAELYDPVANTFTLIASTMTTGREFYGATLLPDNTVLLTGGVIDAAPFASAEIYNPVADTFTALSNTLTTARTGHTATLLANGQVLLSGGTSTSVSPTAITALNTTELYNPATNSFTALAATLNTTRLGHTATLLANGKVIVIGGGTGTGGPVTVLNTVEEYGP